MSYAGSLAIMLYSEKIGDEGETMVFLHGIAGSTRYWKSRVEPLTRHYQLLLVDLLGYGQSPKPWTKYTVDRHVDELYQVVRDQKAMTIVGHSFGAIVAIAFCARFPHLVKRLTLIGLPYFGDKQGAIKYFSESHLAERYVTTNIAFAALACMMTRWVLRWFLPYVLRDMPREVVEDLTRHTWRSYTSSLWDGVYGHDLFADADSLDPNCNVLCLHGSADKTAPLSGVQKLLANRSRWKIQILEDGDHHPLLREPNWCLQQITLAMRN
ncbi:alpha/beta fold hydrolase [Parasphingorhabdus sp.]|uniref:alpha/beta fold hydrolase n=1 Tax=Parasphingorhabdus sp. TaxID=2709688 RepID=UPI003BB1F024